MRLHYLIILFIIILFNCQQNTVQKVQSKHQTVQKQVDLVSVYNKTLSILKQLPQPTDVYMLINKYDLKFDYQLLNSITFYTKYETSFEKAFNLGVYISDLLYAATFKQAQYEMNYLGVLRKLSYDLDYDASISDSLTESLETNIENPQVIYNLIMNSYKKIIDEFHRNNQLDLAIVSLNGFWLESFYISINTLKLLDENQEVYDIFENYFDILEQLLGIFNEFKTSSNKYLTLYTELKELKALFLQSSKPLTFAQYQRLLVRTNNLREIYTKH